MLILNPNQSIQLFDSMYPCEVKHVVTTNNIEQLPIFEYVTCYGYVITGSISASFNKDDIRIISYGQYFCLTGKQLSISVEQNTNVAIFFRYGFKGQNVVGGPLEQSGRLMYIDGCSDSLLVYPPRLGDPSLNHLHFPRGIDQSFHIHPSIRLGVVVKGQGIADVKTQGNIESIPLEQSTVFVLQEREEHRFRTLDSEMDVIAFHPDGDWGPTDHNHTMLNRTYITK
jgi:hypothetical protein